MMVVRQSKQSRAVNEPPTRDLGRARTNAHSTARERVREMGVGVSDDDDDVIIVGETLARADSDDAPPSKRARPDEAPSRPVESLGNNASAGETTREPPLFRLFTTRGLRDEHNRGCASLADVISGPVRWAVAMNYMVDGAYLAAACPSLFRIPRVVWIHGQDDISSYTPRPSGWTLHKPPVPPYGTHHTKAFLLVYPTGVRVCLHTANLIERDLTVMSNAFWAQDFPRKTPASPATSEFEEDLVRYLRRLQWRGGEETVCGVREMIAPEAFRAFDFSTAGAKLIASVPGRHSDRELTLFGHMALRRALSKQTFASRFEHAPVLCQFTSIGSIAERWMEEMRASLCAGKSDSSAARLGGARLGDGPMQLIWPTAEEVRSSLGGYTSGGSIPGPSKNIHRPHVTNKLHRWRGGEVQSGDANLAGSRGYGDGDESSGSAGEHPFGRGKAMPHIKTFARYERPTGGDAAPGASRGARLAWCLIGSHNLSAAAWGKLEKNATQLAVLSYELGALFYPSLVGKRVPAPFSCVETVGLRPVRCLANARPRLDEGETDKDGEATFVHAKTADATISPGAKTAMAPMPFPVPPTPYATRQGDVPWVVDAVYPRPDMWGMTWPFAR